MKKYELKIYPDSVLREKAQPVFKINSVISHLIRGMSKIMYIHNGIGLAAPQVGVLQKVIIADIGEGLISMINPEVITGFGENSLDERCLSIPDTAVNVKRKESIFVRYMDKKENEIECELIGLTARVIQHEIDHLNGVLIIDYDTLDDGLKLNSKNNLKY